MDLQINIKHFLFTARIYSVVQEICRGVIFYFLLQESELLWSSQAWGVSFISLFMWIYFNWQSDWIQGDPGRLKPNFFLCYSPLFAALVIAYFFGGLSGILGVIIYVSTIVLYSLKSIVSYLGFYGPFLRAMTILGHFIMIYSIWGGMISIEVLMFLIFIGQYKSISNFIGDIRDINTDNFEFPAQKGFIKSIQILRVLFLGNLILCFLNNEFVVETLIVSIISWISIEYTFRRYFSNPDFAGYVAHRVITALTPVMLVAILYAIGLGLNSSIAIILLVFFSQFLYNRTPGKFYTYVR